jgi:hypothetical protein
VYRLIKTSTRGAEVRTRHVWNIKQKHYGLSQLVTFSYRVTQRIITNKYEQTGIYRLACAECKKVYIGQTGRTLKIKYKEHIRSIKYNRDDSGFATHTLNNAHCYGKMEDIMEKIDHARKGRPMNINENFNIYT